MKKNIKAVFYKYKYYIFPEEFSDLTKIGDGTVISAKRLKEERCMAPDFIYESILEESVEIEDARLLFPVEVNLYSGKEYDELLSKQIDKVCHGCSRFIDNDDESLDGHHREISLDGICYERETDGDAPTYAIRTYWFLCAVAEHVDEIKKCIDAGNLKKLDKLCRSFKCIPMPYKFYGDKHDGKYRLFWRSFGADHIDLALQYFTAKAASFESSPIKDTGLEIVPYIPKGADVGLGKLDENAPLFCVQEKYFPNNYQVNVYSKKKLSDKKYDKLLFEVHHNLCYRIGEDAVIRAVSGYEVVSDAPEKLLTLTELIELLTKNVEENDKNAYPVLFPIWWEKQENALYGRRNFDGVTACYPLTELSADSSQIAEADFYGCFAYAYVFVPSKLENLERITSVLVEYFTASADIPEPIIIKEENLGCFAPIGAGACLTDADENSEETAGDKPQEPQGNNGVVLDFLVTDENAFFRFIKILAPVLRNYNARLVVVNGSGVNEYECDYKITPVGSTDVS